MKKNRIRIGLIAAAAVVATVATAAGQRTQSADGTARVATRVERSADRQVRMPVDIDLTSVSARGSVVALGGYVARLDFDATKVEYVSVAGGSSKAFSAEPIATNADRANDQGVVKLAAYNTADDSATGKLNVANVVFRELARGGAASIKVTIESASSTLVKDASGAIQQFEIRVAE